MPQSNTSVFLESFIYVVIIVVVIVLAYFVSRFLAVRVSQMSKGKYIEIIDRVAIGREKSVFIVKVGEKMFLVCETNDSSSVITKLDESDLVLLNEQERISFGDIFQNYLEGKNNANKKDNLNALNLDAIKEKLNSSKDILSKIKGKEKNNDKE